METNKSADYEAVLADLEAQRVELDSAISVIKRYLGKPSDQHTSSPDASTKRHSHSVGLTTTAFFGMGVADAAVKYLGIVKEDKSTPDIAKALLDHGLKTVAKDFATTVFSALDREKTEGDVVHPKRGLWGLAEWYPGMRKPKKDESDKKETSAEPVKRKIVRERTRIPIVPSKRADESES